MRHAWKDKKIGKVGSSQNAWGDLSKEKTHNWTRNNHQRIKQHDFRKQEGNLQS